MWTKAFWQDTAERAVKTAAQFGAVALGTVVFTSVDQVINAGALVGLAILFGAATSVLTSVGSESIGDKGTPSLVRQ